MPPTTSYFTRKFNMEDNVVCPAIELWHYKIVIQLFSERSVILLSIVLIQGSCNFDKYTKRMNHNLFYREIKSPTNIDPGNLKLIYIRKTLDCANLRPCVKVLADSLVLLFPYIIYERKFII